MERIEEIKSRLIELFEDVKPGEDYANCTNLVTGGVVTSLEIVALVNEIGDEFDVEFTANELVPENFDSLDQLAALIVELQDE